MADVEKELEVQDAQKKVEAAELEEEELISVVNK